MDDVVVPWVTSGLALRIQGALAEDAVTAQLRASDSVFAVVASLKFGASDIDRVVAAKKFFIHRS